MLIYKFAAHVMPLTLIPLIALLKFPLFCLWVQLMTIITTIDDLNYPEKTQTYYVVNAPCVFSACWKVDGYFQLDIYCYQDVDSYLEWCVF